MTRNETARHFLEFLFGAIPQDSKLELRVKRNGEQPHQHFYDSAEKVDIEKFGFDEHVWFGCALRRAGATTGTLTDLTWLAFLWADFDNVSDPDAIVTKLSKFEFRPSMIVNSGGGLHVYWKLARPLDLRVEPQRLAAQETVFGLARALGADPTVHDPSRVLRVPATMNVGNGKSKVYNPPREVIVLVEDPQSVYQMAELAKYRRPLERKTPIVAVPLPPAPTTGAPVMVAALKVPDRMRELITKGWTKGCGYASRSELDLAACIAMLRGEHTDADIAAIFRDPSFGIHSKYKEKGADGDRYLAQTIARAREWMEEHKQTSELIREENGRLEGKREKGWEPIFTHPIKALAELVGDETGFRVEVLTNDGAVEKTLRDGDFASNPAFRRALGITGAWTGTDRDVSLMIPYLKSQQPPKHKTVRTIGHHGDRVVFPNAHLHNGAIVDGSDYLYVGGLSDARLLDNEDWPGLAKVLVPTLFKMHRAASIVPVVGWFAASFLAPHVRKLGVDGAFPILMIYGTPETGKTTTVEVMSRLCGRDRTPYSISQLTKFTLLDYLSSSNTLPIIFDEFRRGDTRTMTHDFYPTLRSAYQGGTSGRGRQDLTVVRYFLTAPVVVVGEVPFRDQALTDRSIHVRFTRTGKDVDALNAVAALPVTEFNAGMYRHVLAKDTKALWTEARALLPQYLIDNLGRVRMLHAWQTAAFGLLLLDPYVSGDALRDMIRNMDAAEADTRDDVATPSSDIIYEAVRVIGELIRAKQIEDGIDFVIRTDGTQTLLWIVPAVVLPKIEDYMRRQADSLMTRDAINMRMREQVGQPDSVVVKYQANVRIGKRVVRGIALDLDLVEKSLGIGVDVWLQRAIASGSVAP